jgi:hypothetical protein
MSMRPYTTFTEEVELSHNDGVSTVKVEVEFEGIEEHRSGLRYWFCDDPFKFCEPINLKDFDEWEQDIVRQIRAKGYLEYC